MNATLAVALQSRFRRCSIRWGKCLIKYVGLDDLEDKLFRFSPSERRHLNEADERAWLHVWSTDRLTEGLLTLNECLNAKTKMKMCERTKTKIEKKTNEKLFLNAFAAWRRRWCRQQRKDAWVSWTDGYCKRLNYTRVTSDIILCLSLLSLASSNKQNSFLFWL